MNRYTITGVLDFLIGGIVLITPLGMLVFVLPKILTIYSEANADVTRNIITTYISIAIQIFVGLLNIFLGTRMFSKDQIKRIKYFKWATIVPIVTFIIFSLLIITSTLAAIFPLYYLTITRSY